LFKSWYGDGWGKLNSGKNFGEPNSTVFELDRVNNIYGMNILTHPVHTGYQYDLAQTEHDFTRWITPGPGEIFWTPIATATKDYHRLKRLMDAEVNSI